MSDPQNQAAVAAPTVADAGSVPAPAPAPTPSDSSAAASAPPAPEPAPVAAPAAPAAPAATSLLSDAPKPDAAPPAPPADAPPAADPAPAEPAKADAPVVLPTYEFKLPEGFEAAPEQMGKLNEMLGALEVDAKIDHAKAQEFGQKALEYHLTEMQRVVNEIDQQGRAAWESMRDEWRNNFKSDPEMGGNRQQTTLAACTRIIDQFGGTEAQRTELRQILATTGAGDHPALIRLLANVGKALGEGRPVPAVVPKSPVVPSRKERRYHASNGAA